MNAVDRLRETARNERTALALNKLLCLRNEEISNLTKQRDELVEALSICAKKFRHYEEIHAAKPDPIKAANNAALAKMAEDVIAKVEGI